MLSLILITEGGYGYICVIITRQTWRCFRKDARWDGESCLRRLTEKFYENGYTHYKLEDSTGPDAASFARTPAMLKEVL